MGREIRRVPRDWKHPKYTKETTMHQNQIGGYIPLHDNDYVSAAEAWIAEFDLWRAGTHEAQPSKYARYFWEYSTPPDPASYRHRKWTESRATHYQLYENVSEGTPLTPPMPSAEALVEYLVQHGDFWDQQDGRGGWPRAAAERMVASGYAPSLVMTRTSESVSIHEPRDMETL